MYCNYQKSIVIEMNFDRDNIKLVKEVEYEFAVLQSYDKTP